MASLHRVLIVNISTTMMNNKADIGQPCLSPLVNFNCLIKYPLFVTTIIGSVYNTSIHLIKLSPKLNFLKHSYIKFHSTVSNAFSKSTERRMPFLFDKLQ